MEKLAPRPFFSMIVVALLSHLSLSTLSINHRGGCCSDGCQSEAVECAARDIHHNLNCPVVLSPLESLKLGELLSATLGLSDIVLSTFLPTVEICRGSPVGFERHGSAELLHQLPTRRHNTRVSSNCTSAMTPDQIRPTITSGVFPHRRSKRYSLSSSKHHRSSSPSAKEGPWATSSSLLSTVCATQTCPRGWVLFVSLFC